MNDTKYPTKNATTMVNDASIRKNFKASPKPVKGVALESKYMVIEKDPKKIDIKFINYG